MTDMKIVVENDAFRGGGRGRGGGGGGRFRNKESRSRPYMDDPDDDTPWKHDKFLEYEREFSGAGAGRGARSTDEVTKEDLQELLSQYGAVVNVRVEYDKSGRSLGNATAVFRERTSAAKAQAELDGRTLDGEEMRVQLSSAGGAGAGGSGRLAGRLGPPPASASARGGRREGRDGRRQQQRDGPSFTVSLTGSGGGAWRGGNDDGDGDDTCFNCGKRGHFARQCRADSYGGRGRGRGDGGGFRTRGGGGGGRGRGRGAREPRPQLDADALDRELDDFMAKGE